ncbi:MAG: GNAT family N-acetyltransferase [Bacilli bacterium]|nr:GNAT family N-acetyltransferase [Bacilli bacterium]
MEVEVKKLTKKNIEEIIPLRIELQKFDFKGNLGLDEKILENKTREFLNQNIDKELYMYGTYVDSELVSICGLTIFKYFPQADDLSCKVGYITSVYTKENHRSKGYQKKVFLECIELGKRLGINKFKLSTKNPVAMKMYESVGFIDDEYAKKLKI